MTIENIFVSRIKILIGSDSPTSFARKTGIDPKTVIKAIGGTIPGHAVLKKISDGTGRSVEWILGVEKTNRVNQSIGTSENDPQMVRMYRELAKMDTDTLGEIQTWINDMERLRPGFTGWFRLEFQNRFPEFDEWKKKIIKKQHTG